MRTVLRTSLAVVLVALVGAVAAGCGSSDDNKSTSTAASSTTTKKASSLEGTSLTYVSFGGNLQDSEMKAFVEPWAQKNGVKVSSDSPTDYAKIKAQVTTGNVTWDVVHSDPFFVTANCGKFFEELDTAKVTSLGQIPSDLVSNKCEVPHMRYGIGLYYNADKFKSDPPKTWADFFDTKKFPGKRGVWGYSQSGLIEAALLADGVDKGSLYPLDLPRAFKKLDTIKSNLKFAQAPGEVADQVVAGSVDMALIYTGRAYDAAKQGAKFKMAWGAPTITSYESVAVVKGSKHMDGAMSLVNYFGEAEPQSAFAQLIAYAPTNETAKPQLDSLLSEYSVASHPASDYVALDQSWWAQNFDKANQEFTDWQAG